MNDYGLGYMLHWLSGDDGTPEALMAARDKVIKQVVLDPVGNDGDGALQFEFTDGSSLLVYDCARSCCESRYLNCDDDLNVHSGARFQQIEVLSGPIEAGEYGDQTESMFLRVHTTAGIFTVAAYNAHNGYYGGIAPVAQYREPQ